LAYNKMSGAELIVSSPPAAENAIKSASQDLIVGSKVEARSIEPSLSDTWTVLQNGRSKKPQFYRSRKKQKKWKTAKNLEICKKKRKGLKRSGKTISQN
jgi:hypothetical protein